MFGTTGSLDTASAGTATITNNAGATTTFNDDRDRRFRHHHELRSH